MTKVKYKVFTFSKSKQSIQICSIILILAILILTSCTGISAGNQDNLNLHVENNKEKCSEGSRKCESQSNNEDDKQSTLHRYSKETNENWGNIRNLIAKAEEAYLTREQDNLTESDCSIYETQIDNDLKPFMTKGISEKDIDDVSSRGSLYQIINGKLFRSKSCKFPARCVGIEHFLKKISKDLPDMEFVVNTSDWPEMSTHFPNPLPLFSFSKTKDYFDISYPAWTFWEGGPAIPIYPTGIGRWDLLRKSLIKASKKYAWEDKVPKVFFRGSRTSHERDALILLSRKNPDLVDAKYTKNQAWKSNADTLNAPAAEEVSFEDHCKFKYLFNYRGVAASFRFKHLFLCKSLVFHVGNSWIEFFYPELKPWVHYIPINPTADENELMNMIQFANENDEIANRIAERGFNFIKTNLKMRHITCYWKKLLGRYSELIKYKVKQRDDVIAI